MISVENIACSLFIVTQQGSAFIEFFPKIFFAFANGILILMMTSVHAFLKLSTLRKAFCFPFSSVCCAFFLLFLWEITDSWEQQELLLVEDKFREVDFFKRSSSFGDSALAEIEIWRVFLVNQQK